jgi:gamma-glutamyltranspeptidase
VGIGALRRDDALLERGELVVGGSPGSTQRDGLGRRAAGRQWAIATPHALATEAGRDAFRNGGNALDAALAAAAVLTVVYPHMCSIGGDLIGLHRAPDGEVAAVLGVGAAAAGADADGLREVHGSMPLFGPQTITVPGMLGGWEALAARGARHGLSTAIAPAIEYARAGVPLAGSVSAALVEEAPRLIGDAGLRGVFFADGAPLRAGQALRQPALAETLATIAGRGVEAFYHGDVGESVIAGLAALGAPLSTGDLEAHATATREPLRAMFDALELVTAPPVSQGFVLLLQLAALTELGMPGAAALDAGSLAEVFRLAAADRDRWLCDPEYHAPPRERRLSRVHAGKIADAARQVAATGQDPSTSAVRTSANGDTIALVAADAEGHAVSLIQSLFFSFGSGILEPDTGILCQNRGACFTLDRSSPNLLAPGKRPAHTLMPTLALADGRLTHVLGTKGGRAQPQILTHVLLSLVAGADPADALDAPRWALEDAVSSAVVAEGRVGAGTRDQLERGGFACRLVADWDEALGHAHAISVGPDGFIAASDPRSDGAAAAG